MLINPKIESDIVWVDVLTLSVYKEEAIYNGREDMIVVTHRETGE